MLILPENSILHLNESYICSGKKKITLGKYRMEENSFEARLLHTPYERPDAYNALSMPVYHTAAYEFDSAEAMEAHTKVWTEFRTACGQ